MVQFSLLQPTVATILKTIDNLWKTPVCICMGV